MSKIQVIVAVIISAVAMIIFLCLPFYPDIVKDDKSLILLGIAMLPWLTLFFKKLKLPGGVEAESDREQGSTNKPAPPFKNAELQQRLESDKSPRFTDLNSHAKKILKTLWKYQKEVYKDNYGTRWTFTVFHVAEDYSSYIIGLGVLLERGIISLAKDEKTAQCMLTNEGIKFCEDNSDEIGKYESYYKF